MAFPDFTLDSIRADLGLTLSPTGLFPSASPVSEAVISPVLMAAAELGSPPLIVHSGEWLDVDASRELNGEADSIIARSPPVPYLVAPLLGQCIARMEAVRLFNQKAGADMTVYGCVTTGEVWQFLRHDVTTVALDTRRYAIQQLDLLLGVFHDILK